MNKAALFLVLLLAGEAAAQLPPVRAEKLRDGGRYRDWRPRESGYAFFEAFPSSGAGTSGVCSTTAPTGAKGEALTFTRGSNGTCTKTASGGLATTGIANGDLVVLSSNVARVEYDANGTLGLLVESSRTNSALRSEELDNAVWTRDTAGSSAPTVLGSADASPGASSNARSFRLFATTAGQFSRVVQQNVNITGAASNSIYYRGVSGSGTFDFCALNAAGSAFNCTTCAFVSTEWRRCLLENFTGLATNNWISFGNLTGITGSAGVARPQQDVLVWGAQVELGAYATSYIPTTNATMMRAIESPSFTLASGVGPTACVASSVTWPSSAVGAVNFFALGSLGGANMTLYRTSNTAAGYQINAAITAPAVSAIGTTTHRSLLYDNAGTRAAFWDGASVSAPAATMASSSTDVWLGRNVSGTPADGIVSRVQVDPSPLRCSAQ